MPDPTPFLEHQKKPLSDRDELILDRVQQYGFACIDIGFFDKGTEDYTEAFKRMMQAFADIVEIMGTGKEPKLKLYPPEE